MRSKLIAELRARAETSFEADKERGVIDSASLYGLRLGEKRVFAQRGEEITNQVAVSIVVDQSGSMDGSRIENARLAAIAVGETLDALGCDFEITGFWNIDRACSSRHDRDGSFHFFNFKGFGENFKRVKTRLLRMKADGWNSDPEAVLGAAKRLAVQEASRKILIVMSDGQPCGGQNVKDYLREVVSKISKAGIEIYGIGIESQAVAQYYNADTGSAHVVVNKIDDLAVSVFKLLKGKLLRRGRRAA
jgi:cobalamin biosynthesis protein CobT